MIVPPWAPYAVGVSALFMAMAWAHDYGRDTEREKWQARETAAVLKMRERENEWQSQIDAAGGALSVLTAENERLTQRATTNVRNYYAARPADNLVCLAPDVLRAIEDSDKASGDSATSTAGAH